MSEQKPRPPRRGPELGPPPPIGTVYLLRFKHVAFRLGMSVNSACRLRVREALRAKETGFADRFPKPVTPPGCLGLFLESDVLAYVELLKAERGHVQSVDVRAARERSTRRRVET